MKIRTPAWVRDAVFYQIFPDRFAQSRKVPRKGLHLEAWDAPPTVYGFKGGDLLGVAEHLDYLKDLGVTAIYLNPVFASASNHRYHTYDYYNVDPLLGGNAALRALLDAAHRRKMRVVLDGVFNHASRGFWQFHQTLESGGASPYRDWFHFDSDRLNGLRPWGAYPSPSEDEALRSAAGSLSAIGYRAWWDLPALPKFNTDTPAVREFIFDVAEHWLRFGIDGWRLDVPAEIDDDAFWREFRRRVKKINPEAYIVGEIWQRADRWLQGDQFDAVMNYPVTVAALGFFPGRFLDLDETNRAGGYRHSVRPLDAGQFADSIDAALNWYDPAITQAQLNLLDSHDTPRFLTSAGGDRDSLRLSLLFMFTIPGAPCIYYGDEIGLDGRHDPDCRKAFPWERKRWDTSLHEYTQTCIRLRKAHPALRRGAFHRLLAEDGVYAFGRRLGGERLVAAFNVLESERTVRFSLDPLGLRRPRPKVIFGKARTQLNAGILTLTLPARSAVVLE